MTPNPHHLFLRSFFTFPSFRSNSKVFFLILFIFIIHNLLSPVLFAQSFDSPSYHIDWGHFNMTSGQKQSANFRLTDTVGQNAPGRYASDGYTVKAGFQYLYEKMEPFYFKIDNLDISFESLAANIGSTKSNITTITTPSGRGYEILTIANHPLTNQNFIIIPDTNCDTGCTINSANPWLNNTSYGFGYNAVGIDAHNNINHLGTLSYFPSLNHFRPFAHLSQNQTPQIIASETNPVTNRRTRITYKIVISPQQATGDYQTSINLIAIPKY